VTWEVYGDTIHVRAETKDGYGTAPITGQLIVFNLATERERHRKHNRASVPAADDREWSREKLYEN
jgi:hypothetical protein